MHRKSPEKINMKSFYLADEFVGPFAKGLKLSNQVRILNVARTQLDEKGAREMVENIPETLVELDASENPNFGTECVELLAHRVLGDASFKLATLKLENCKLGDKGAIILGAALESAVC